MISRRRFLAGCVAGAASPGLLAETTAAPLRIIVPFPAGGGTDVLARLLADKLRGNYSPSVTVENRVGASGRTAVEAVKAAAPDGSTVLFTPDFLMTVYPHSFRELSYDPLADFAPIALVARSGLAVAAGPALPSQVRTIQDFIGWAKANPKQAFYATTAAGGTPHLVGVMLGADSGVALSPVHYKGGAPALQDLLGGQVPVSINPLSELLPQLREGGKIRVLAVTSEKRSRFLPDVPTLAESGYPRITLAPWLGFFAPARTPAGMVKQLANGIADASQHGAVQQGMLKMGLEAAAMTPVGFAAVVKGDLERWGPVVKASGFSAGD